MWDLFSMFTNFKQICMVPLCIQVYHGLFVISKCDNRTKYLQFRKKDKLKKEILTYSQRTVIRVIFIEFQRLLKLKIGEQVLVSLWLLPNVCLTFFGIYYNTGYQGRRNRDCRLDPYQIKKKNKSVAVLNCFSRVRSVFIGFVVLLISKILKR